MRKTTASRRKSTASRDLFSKVEDEARRKPARPGKTAESGQARSRGRTAEDAYTAADIEVLEGLEPVRRRPGMYIGGTDEKALHHLFAEVLDNAMDEAVEGHADRIEVDFEEDGFLTVTDNGRGIPVDPHPKFKKKSALEVIMTTLHSGGKFNSKVYDTSGGLHGVGVSVANALSETLEVEVARGQKLYRQSYTRGEPRRSAEDGRARSRTGAAPKCASGPTPRSSARAPPSSLRGCSAWRAPRPISSAGSRSAGLAPRRCSQGDSETPASATLHFPGGLKDFLASRIEGQEMVTREMFAGKSDKNGHGSVEWAIVWVAREDGFLSSYCNTVPTPEGGTHEAGFRAGLVKGLRAYGELAGNKRTAQITAEDVLGTAAAMLSLFMREPEFQGQTKDKLASQEATRIVENAVRDAFDHWLAGNPAQANLLLDWVIDRAEERRAAQEGKGDRPADGDAAPPAAGQARRLRLERGARHGDLHRRGRFRGRIGQAGARPRHPSRAAAQRQDPQRRERKLDQARRQSAHRRSHPGARLRHRHALSRGGPPLREGGHHDRRRRGRRPYRLAAHHLLLPRDARADRRRPPLSRRAAALSPEPGRQGAVRAQRRP